MGAGRAASVAMVDLVAAGGAGDDGVGNWASVAESVSAGTVIGSDGGEDSGVPREEFSILLAMSVTAASTGGVDSAA